MWNRLDVRLTASIAALVLLSLLAVSVLLGHRARRNELAALDHGLEGTARTLAVGVAGPLLDGDAEGVQAHLRQVAAYLPHRLTIIDGQGQVLADTHEQPEAMDNHRGRPEVARALAGRVGVAERRSGTTGVNTRYLAVPIRDSNGLVAGAARVAVALSEVEAAQRRNLAFAALVGLAALGLALVAAARVSQSVSRPLADMSRLAEDMARGRLHQRIAVPPVRELATLVEALHTMGGKLHQLISELAREKTYLEAILDSMADGVVVAGTDMEVTLANRAMDAILATAGTKGAVGRPLVEVLRNSALLDAFAATLRDGRPRSIVVEWPDGGPPSQRRVFQVATSPLWKASAPLVRSGVVAILRDITDLRRLERVRSDFVANVSHELRTPLTVLQGFQETLLESDVSPAQQRRFLEIMARETNRMANLVNDLLQLSELEAGTHPLSTEPVELAPLVERVRETFAEAMAGEGIRWEVDIPPGLPPVPAEPRLLEQVFHNLVSNAIKYMGGGGGTISITARRAGRYVEIAVADTGVGIPEELLPRVFERFYRADPARSRQHGGTGLGLSIVRHIVERHGGRVWAESQVGQGTTIRFTLPLWPAGADARFARF